MLPGMLALQALQQACLQLCCQYPVAPGTGAGSSTPQALTSTALQNTLCRRLQACLKVPTASAQEGLWKV
jgi:hypothetical protein